MNVLNCMGEKKVYSLSVIVLINEILEVNVNNFVFLGVIKVNGLVDFLKVL